MDDTRGMNNIFRRYIFNVNMSSYVSTFYFIASFPKAWVCCFSLVFTAFISTFKEKSNLVYNLQGISKMSLNRWRLYVIATLQTWYQVIASILETTFELRLVFNQSWILCRIIFPSRDSKMVCRDNSNNISNMMPYNVSVLDFLFCLPQES